MKLNALYLFCAGWLLTLGSTFAQAAEAIVDVDLPSLDPPAPLTLWEILKSGGPVMIPLAVLSIIALALIIFYFLTLTRRSMVTGRYMQTAEALIRKGDLLGLLAYSSRHGQAAARIMTRTLDFVTTNPSASFEEAKEIAETEGTRQASALNQKITYLADIGTISPMLGLFGTVVGMIKSFSVVASDIASTRPMLLAGGVSEALVTTAAGLLIGIPAMAAYAYFRGRVQTQIATLEAASTRLMALLSANYPKEGKAPNSPSV
ncbi:MAG: MotA/TolQ/ExbB proton channel family protein [Chthoniobacterales bacterium]